MINSREDIRDYILDLETRFPVNSWQFAGFHIWPILRLRLFFYVIKKTERRQSNTTSTKHTAHRSKDNSFVLRLKKMRRFIDYYAWNFGIQPKKYLFVAQDAHRVNHLGKRFNRFFDVLIDRHQIVDDCMYFETDHQPLSKLYNAQNVQSYVKALQGFMLLRKFKKNDTVKFEGEGYANFLKELEQSDLTKDFALSNSISKLTKWYNQSAAPKQEFFQISLSKLQPVQVSVLCYYSEDIMMLLTAANRLNIKTVEMQHGPQSDVHLCYSHWSQMPQEGYGVLPRNFWCWDQNSTQAIDQWAIKNLKYNTKVIGNPWVQYWKTEDMTYEGKGYVLFSLQPSPVSLERSFHPEILSLIKSSKIPWYIRLHPRQISELPAIKKYLSDRAVLDLVNIDEATLAPLPQVISNAKVHVTHYSGTLIEAAAFCKKTIIFDPLGAQTFSQYIEDGIAIFLDVNDANFKEKFYLEVEKSIPIDVENNEMQPILDLF